MKLNETIDMLATMAVARGRRPLWAPLAYLNPRTWRWYRVMRGMPQQYAERAVFELRDKGKDRTSAWEVFDRAFTIRCAEMASKIIDKPKRNELEFGIKLDTAEFDKQLETVSKRTIEATEAMEHAIDRTQAQLSDLMERARSDMASITIENYTTALSAVIKATCDSLPNMKAVCDLYKEFVGRQAAIEAREQELDVREAELQELIGVLGVSGDMSPLPDDQRGLYNKYLVIKRATGKPVDGVCFVLRPDKDRAAREAMLTYARLCDNEQLSQDLIAWRMELAEAAAEKAPAASGDDIDIGKDFPD